MSYKLLDFTASVEFCGIATFEIEHATSVIAISPSLS